MVCVHLGKTGPFIRLSLAPPRAGSPGAMFLFPSWTIVPLRWVGHTYECVFSTSQ